MNETPDLSHIRVFGSKCWYVVPKHKIKELDVRSREGIFVGYSTQSKGYKIWDLELSKIIVSRDVTFEEIRSDPIEIDIRDIKEEPRKVVVPEGEAKPEVEDNIDSTAEDEPEINSRQHVDADDAVSNSGNEFEQAEEAVQPALKRSTRIRKPTGEWWKGQNLLSRALISQEVPTTYKNATSPENVDFWQSAIDREHDCLARNKTWSYNDYSPGMKILPCRYVFKVKENKPKVRLVALGCRQMYGIDYNETFAPVVTMTTIRTILAVTAHLDLELEKMDVVTAFLNGDLEEDIFMAVPEELKICTTKNKVCKLQKSLCGLKQSPRQWYFKMHEFLTQIGFNSSLNDPCLYIRHLSSGIVLIALYVDDLLIAGSSPVEVQSIKNKLSHRFEMKNMRTAKVILGIQIYRNRSTRRLFISQSEYTRNLLDSFGMINSKSVLTPMDLSYNDTSIKEELEPAHDVPYRQAIGSLMYLMITPRPDIAYAIGKLS